MAFMALDLTRQQVLFDITDRPCFFPLKVILQFSIATYDAEKGVNHMKR